MNIKINNTGIERNIKIEIESSDFKSQTDNEQAVSETISAIKDQLKISNSGNIISTDNKTDIDKKIANSSTKDKTSLSKIFPGVNDISSINNNNATISWNVSKEKPGVLSVRSLKWI